MTLKSFLSVNMAYFSVLEKDGQTRIDPIVSGTNLIKIYSELIGDLSTIEGKVNTQKEFISVDGAIKVEVTPLSRLDNKAKQLNQA